MGLRFQRLLSLFRGVRLSISRHGISASIGPRGASEPVKAPDFTQRAGEFLQVVVRDRMPIEAVRGRMLIENFRYLFLKDLKSFDGDRSMQAIEGFVNYVAGVPRHLKPFMDRLPKGQYEKLKTDFLESVRNACQGVVAQQRTALEKMPEEKLAEAEAQRTLKVVRAAEAGLQK